MTRTITTALILVLSACAPTPPQPKPYDLAMAQNDCAVQNAPFVLLSGCLQSQMQKYSPAWVLL
jgi:hypothetical protein